MSIIWSRKFNPAITYHASGTGSWCLKPRDMQIYAMFLVSCAEQNYLCVYFDPEEWDVGDWGYVMDDPGWHRSLRKHLAELHFSSAAIDAVGYQCDIILQSEKRVIIPVAEPFILECDALHRFVLDPENF